MKRAPGRYDGLTVKQADLLSFIRERAADGETPSFEEMKGALGLKSKSGIHRLIEALEERGYIVRAINRARAIVLVDNPDPIIAASLRGRSRALVGIPTHELVNALKARGFAFTGTWA